MKAAITALGFLALSNAHLLAAEKSGAGVFVSYQDGTLTLDGKSGRLVYQHVGENYKTFQNNEDGPGSKLVSTVRALSGEKLEGKIIPLTRVLPGTLVRVDVETHEINFGFDYRVIGTFVSYEKGKLTLLAADVPAGFVKKPEGKVTVTIDPDIPVLESIDGGYLKFAGAAEKALKAARPGAPITVRSQYDPDVIEIVEIGQPKHRMERYIGESRGPVRGTFMSFKDGILRVRGKGISPQAVIDYERVFARRIGADIPIVESIDGGEYRPATPDALSTLKEGAIVTIRKVEDVILEIQIGFPKKQ
jgi:hypothetical protein